MNDFANKNYLLPHAMREGLMAYLDTKPHGEVKDGYRELEALRVAPSLPDQAAARKAELDAMLAAMKQQPAPAPAVDPASPPMTAAEMAARHAAEQEQADAEARNAMEAHD